MGIEVALPSFLFRFPLLLCITFHFFAKIGGLSIKQYLYNCGKSQPTCTLLSFHIFSWSVYTKYVMISFLWPIAGTQNLNFWPLQIFTVERIWERLTERGSDSKLVILSFN